MKTFDVKHGHGQESIECDDMKSEGGTIRFMKGERVICQFNAAYVHSVREREAEKKDENQNKREGDKKSDSPDGATAQPASAENQPATEPKPA